MTDVQQQPDCKRPRNELLSLVQDINNAQSVLSCSAGEGCDSSILALNESFHNLVEGYLHPSVGLSFLFGGVPT